MPQVANYTRRAFLYGGTTGSAYKNIYDGSVGFNASPMLTKIGAVSTFSISVWFRLNPAATHPSVGITSHNSSKGFLLWVNVAGSGVIASQYKTSTSTNQWVGAASYSIPNMSAFKNPSRLHHAVATFGGGVSNIYLDGALVSSVPFTGAFATSASGYPVGIHYDGYSGGNSSGGSIIDDLSFWNISLDASTVSNMYANKRALVGNEMGLVEVYKFDTPGNLLASNSGTANMTNIAGSGTITSQRGLVF